MRRLISPADMLASEGHYFETSGVASLQIMERAARALADGALLRFPDAENIYIACGPGGNGGDGYACARMLHQAGRKCAVYACAPARSADAVENCRRARELGIPVYEAVLPDTAPDLWIDCLYGTGLSRAPSGISAEMILRMNRDHSAGCGVLAADIPSGLNGETGRAYDPCVHADMTISFQLAKYGHVLQDGPDLCGELIVSDVGFPADIFPANLPSLAEPGDLKSLFIPRRRNIHKSTCGHLLIIAGSFGMAGAAALCARAALRSGVGLVSIACVKSIVPMLQVLAPQAMCIPLEEENGAISADALPAVWEGLKGKTAVAIGPGLSRNCAPQIVAAALNSGLPAVIDADGLNLLAAHGDLQLMLGENHVITPHPGEAARLLGRSCENPLKDAAELAKSGATAVLKGACSVICSPDARSISARGANGMARGGSGDILTGILGALLAEKSPRSLHQSAEAACLIHGLAGEAAQEKYGSRAMNSADILEFLPEVFKAHVD